MMTTPTPINPAAELVDAVAALAAVKADLKAAFIERDGDIDALAVAAVAGEHMLILGPPGTAKSALVKAFSDAMEARYYSILMTKFTTPEEPFGPLDLARLRNGEYRRVTTGRFPEAEVAFLDEVFKSSSAILNNYLTALNEREFDDGGVRVKIPLQFCVGASNELPQDENLGALFDRFLVRRWTRYISDRDNRRALLSMAGEPKVNATISAAQMDAIRAARKRVNTSGIIDAILDLSEAMMAEGLEVSDRRWRKCVKLVQASAVMAGRDVATTEDLMPMADALWDDPEDAPKVYGMVARMVSPDLETALRILDAATSAWTEAGAATADLKDPQVLAGIAELCRALAGMVEEMGRLTPSAAINEAGDKVRGMHTAIARRVNAAVLGF